jgi:hypothetical protein
MGQPILTSHINGYNINGESEVPGLSERIQNPRTIKYIGISQRESYCGSLAKFLLSKAVESNNEASSVRAVSMRFLWHIEESVVGGNPIAAE